MSKMSEDRFHSQQQQHTSNKMTTSSATHHSFYRIVDRDPIEVIRDYKDRWPCLSVRKIFMRLRVYMNRLALLIITNSIFETISIVTIVANSLFLALDDPLTNEAPVY